MTTASTSDRRIASPFLAWSRQGRARDRASFALLVLAVVIAPAVAYPVFVMTVLCFAIFACAFNLLLGYTGLLSFGHSAFFGMASYVAAAAAKRWGLGPELAILAGTASAAGLGLVFGLIAIRRLGIYFAMTTLALAQMVYFVAVQWPGFTGGEDGIQAVPRGMLLGVVNLRNDMAMYAFVSVIFLASMLFLRRVVTSPFGHVLRSIRDNEARAMSLGYQTWVYKLIAFVISAALAGLAGSLKVLVMQVATLGDIHLNMSAEPILMSLIGGLATLTGPVVGAAVIGSMQNYLAGLGAWVTLVQGLVFIICVLAFKQGIVGLVNKALARL